MAHFAEIDENNVVVNIIVIEQEVLDTGIFGNPDNFIQTSYNTHGGIHYNPETGEPDGGVALRKNYASIGCTYDPVRDAFIPPKSYNSWILDENTCWWQAPIPYPDDGLDYDWDEETTSWVQVAA